MFVVESTIRFKFKDVCEQKHDIFIVMKFNYNYDVVLAEFTSLYKTLNRDIQLRNSCRNIKIIGLNYYNDWKVINVFSHTADREVEEYLASLKTTGNSKRTKFGTK